MSARVRASLPTRRGKEENCVLIKDEVSLYESVNRRVLPMFQQGKEDIVERGNEGQDGEIVNGWEDGIDVGEGEWELREVAFSLEWERCVRFGW